MGRVKFVLGSYLFADKAAIPLTASGLLLAISSQRSNPEFWGLSAALICIGLAMFVAGLAFQSSVISAGRRLANARPLEAAWLVFEVFGSQAWTHQKLRREDILLTVIRTVADYGAVNHLGRWRAMVLSFSLLRTAGHLSRQKDLDLDLRSSLADALGALAESKTPPGMAKKRAGGLATALRSS